MAKHRVTIELDDDQIDDGWKEWAEGWMSAIRQVGGIPARPGAQILNAVAEQLAK